MVFSAIPEELEKECQKYYQPLVGEKFTATFKKTHSISSIPWFVLDICNITKKMESGLETIIERFNDRIWKGVYKESNSNNFVLYVKVTFKDKLRKGPKYKFKIVGHNGFHSEKKWKREYKENCGYYFEVEKET